jgi:hypothetical protein
MRRFLVTSMMFGLLPWLSHAQNAPVPSHVEITPGYSLTIADVLRAANTPPNANGAPQLMPVFRSPDGRLLALVALSATSGGPLRPASPQIGAPTDWRLVDITGAVSGNIGLRLGENYNYNLNVGLGEHLLATPTTAASLEVSCVPGANSTLGLPCWASAIGGSNIPVIASEYNAAIGAGWSNNSNFGLDITYNMSWLNSSSTPFPHITPAASDLFGPVTDDPIASALPNIVVPGTAGYTSGIGSTLAAHAHWWPSMQDNIDIGASLSRIQLNALGFNPELSFNQAALSLGLNHGALSGVVIGRVITPAAAVNSGQHFSAIDLGVSWRTPWQGQLSIGTQNLWSSGTPPLSLAPAGRDPDVTQARMPYVQYHQDL